MATALSFDELNQLNKVVRSMPFDKYFGEMELKPEQKKERIDLADSFADEFLFILAWVFYTMGSRTVYSSELIPMFKEAYTTALADSGKRITINLDEYIESMSTEMANSTVNHLNDPYFVSEDRAKYLAENESNTLFNMQDFDDARNSGKHYKKWLAILDERTRPTHAFADGQEQPLELPFDVGGFYMMFPKDDSLGAPASEIIGCRCSVAYF